MISRNRLAQGAAHTRRRAAAQRAADKRLGQAEVLTRWRRFFLCMDFEAQRMLPGS